MELAKLHKRLLQGLLIWIIVMYGVILFFLYEELGSGKIKIAGITINTKQVLELVHSADKRLLLLVLFLVLFSCIVLNPMKMYALVRALGLELSIKDIVLLYLSSLPIMNFSPGQRSASDAYISYMLYLYSNRKEGNKAVAYFLLDGTLTLITMFIIILLLTSSFSIPLELKGTWKLISCLLAVALLGIAAFLVFCQLYLSRKQFRNRLARKLQELYQVYKTGLVRLALQPRYLIIVLSSMFLLYFTWYLELFFLLEALHVKLTLGEIAVSEAAISLVLLLPTTPGDLGTLEAAQLLIYHCKLGIAIPVLVAFYLLYRLFVFLVPSTLGMAAYLWLYFRKIRPASSPAA